MYERNNDYIVALHNAYPTLRRAALAGEQLAKAVEGYVISHTADHDCAYAGDIDHFIAEQLSAYRSAIEEKNIGCDDSTTEVIIATPDDFKCDRCDADYKHEHTTYSAVEEKNV